MKLGAWRRSKGKTQQWLAAQLGVTQPFISSIERAVAPQVPGADFMREAFMLTKGAVRPDDFYDTPRWDRELAAGGQVELDLEDAA